MTDPFEELRFRGTVSICLRHKEVPQTVHGAVSEANLTVGSREFLSERFDHAPLQRLQHSTVTESTTLLHGEILS